MKKFNLKKTRMLVFLALIGWTIQLQAQTSQPFVTTWEVADDGNTATTDDLSITIPIKSGFTYAYTVDWGDGAPDTNIYTGDATHTYSAADTYTVSISGNFPAIYFNNHPPSPLDNSFKIKTIKSWGTQRWLTLDSAFEGCENLTTIEDGAGVPDLTMVTNMADAFRGAVSFTGDLSNWNVSKVTNMSWLFFGAINFNSDLSNWDTSEVSNMDRMFYNATNFSSDLNSWNVSRVTHMNWMLFEAVSFNSDVSNWNVSNVINMIAMFSGATSFNSDLSSWNVSKVTNMVDMLINTTSFDAGNYSALLTGWSSLPTLQDNVTFGAPRANYCAKAGRDILTGTYNWRIVGDGTLICPFVTTWDTELGDPGNATIKLPIIEGAYDVDINNDGFFNEPIDKINLEGTQLITLSSAGINTIAIRSNPTNNTNNQLHINHTATGSTPQKLISIKKWGNIVWTSMAGAFRNCSNMTLADTAGIPDLTIVTEMNSMFVNATSFNGDLSSWNVSNVTDMSSIFPNATSFNGNLSSWNVSNVRYMSSIFANASNFNGDLSSWNVSNVTDMSSIFARATRFNGDLSSWNVSNVRDMSFMFDGASNFNGNLSDWDVSNVTGTAFMFFEATRFNGDLSSWNVSKTGGNMGHMFTNAISFSSENYDALLTGWSSLPTLQNDVEFGAPQTTYCAGKAGRDILTGTYNWNITGDNGEDCPVPFVTTWNTQLGTEQTGSTTIKLPITEGAYDVDLSYDGTTFNADMPNQTGTIEIDFGVRNAGEHIIAISPNPTSNTNKQLRINHQALSSTPQKLISIDKWGNIVWTSMESAFQNCSNMTLADTAGIPDLTMVTGMEWMFSGATNFTGDLSTWDVSNVTNMKAMFEKTASFDSDLSSWNISQVVNTGYMFNQAANFTGNLSRWNVSNVADMQSMFVGATQFISDLSTWNVSQVIDMGEMFYFASNFTSDLSRWNVSNVADMSNMFEEATSFTSDLSRWNVSNVADMSNMFEEATSFTSDLSRWNVSNVADMQSMFVGATRFISDLSTWNVSQVIDMGEMFYFASSFTSDLSSWDISNVADMSNMFEEATSFTSDLSTWDVSNVADMSNMFEEATSFTSDLSTWNVSNVTDMENMFQHATSFSAENYDALLLDWSNFPTLQNDVIFGAPPVSYCAGKPGREILTGTYNWTITGDWGEDCSAVTSVDEEFLSNTKIYPNPTGEKLNVESPFEIEKLELYSILGAKIFSVSKTNALDLTSLRQGIYILKVFSGDRVFAKKVIKD